MIIVTGGPRNSTSDQGRQQVVEMLDILPESIKREENCSRIVSFYVKGKPANYNIKFKSDEQAKVFALYKVFSVYQVQTKKKKSPLCFWLCAEGV